MCFDKIRPASPGGDGSDDMTEIIVGEQSMFGDGALLDLGEDGGAGAGGN